MQLNISITIEEIYHIKILNLHSEKNEINVERFGLDKAKIIWGTINDIHTIKDSMSGVDLVVHTAAKIHVDDSIENPTDHFYTNIMGTNNILETAREFKVPVIHVSTCEVYGYQDEDLNEFCEFVFRAIRMPSNFSEGPPTVH